MVSFSVSTEQMGSCHLIRQGRKRKLAVEYETLNGIYEQSFSTLEEGEIVLMNKTNLPYNSTSKVSCESGFL